MPISRPNFMLRLVRTDFTIGSTRLIGTNYTNDRPYPIYVMVTSQAQANGSLLLTIGGKPASLTGQDGGRNNYGSVEGWVNPGESYVVTNPVALGGGSSWVEWR